MMKWGTALLAAIGVSAGALAAEEHAPATDAPLAAVESAKPEAAKAVEPHAPVVTEVPHQPGQPEMVISPTPAAPATPAAKPESPAGPTATGLESSVPPTGAEAPKPAAPLGPVMQTIHVSADAPVIAKAEAQALAQGQEEAFGRIVRARDPDRATGILKKTTPADRALLVKSVSATKEIRRAGHYEADVTYAFDAEKMSALLDESKGLVPEFNNDALLVLPVYDNGKELLIWQKENSWRKAMNASVMGVGQGLLVVPFGDPRDVGTVTPEIVLAGNKPVLASLAQRYGTGNLVIATAKIESEGGTRTAEVRLRRPGDNASDDMISKLTALGASETDEALLIRLARDAAVRLTASTAHFSLFAPVDADKLKGQVIRVEFDSSRTWAVVREQIKDLPGVEFSDVGAMSSTFAQITLYYRGEADAIKAALEGRGLTLRETGPYWTLTPGDTR